MTDPTATAERPLTRQKALLEAGGTQIEDMDVAIGSVALTLGARVATYNSRHLGRLDGLVVDDWTESTGA